MPGRIQISVDTTVLASYQRTISGEKNDSYNPPIEEGDRYYELHWTNAEIPIEAAIHTTPALQIMERFAEEYFEYPYLNPYTVRVTHPEIPDASEVITLESALITKIFGSQIGFDDGNTRPYLVPEYIVVPAPTVEGASNSTGTVYREDNALLTVNRQYLQQVEQWLPSDGFPDN